MADPLSITVVGTGYVGLVSGTCLAAKGHTVRVLDLRPEVVATINRGIPTIHEAGLPDLLADVVRHGRLVAAEARPEAIGDADVVLLCVGTPSHEGAIDLAQIRAASAMVGASGRKGRRCAAVTPSARIRPPRTCGSADVALANMIGTLPAIRSVSAGAPPR